MDFGEVIRVHLMEVRKDISDISAAKAYLLDKYEVIKGIMGPIRDRCQALLKNATVYFCAVYSDETPERWKEKLANWWEAYLFPNE